MMSTQKALEAVSLQVIAYRDSKGFHATTWDTLPVKLCCIKCEIDEIEDALDGYSTHYGQREVRFECADIAMYTLSILHDLYEGQWTLRNRYHGGARVYSSSSEATRPLRREARRAFEQWRRGNRKDVMICLELVLCALEDLRTRVIRVTDTLAHDIEWKIENAANRPLLHGGKDPRS